MALRGGGGGHPEFATRANKTRSTSVVNRRGTRRLAEGVVDKLTRCQPDQIQDHNPRFCPVPLVRGLLPADLRGQSSAGPQP